MTYPGRHYETGTIANAMAVLGAPVSEALALGASGGIAFGYFVFEYTGHLPHVALLTRNTFSPFERALDNLGIRREERTTTNADKAESNLQLELDAGNAVLVWADVFSMPYRGLNPQMMWQMQPVLVVGQEGDDFLVADGSSQALRVSSSDLNNARGRVKKDRFRTMVLELPDPELLRQGLVRGIQTCTALFLDKPPAGSANNFGITGMRHWAKLLTDTKSPKGWAKTFQPGPRLTQALAGCVGQPGVWDWIETWGTSGSGDRATYAQFLREAAGLLEKPGLADLAEGFERSAKLWSALAEAAMADEVPELARLKELKRRHLQAWLDRGAQALPERQAIRAEMKSLVDSLADPAKLTPFATGIQDKMSHLVLEIADLEEKAVTSLREAVG